MADPSIIDEVRRRAQAAGLPPGVVEAIVAQESGFNPATRPIGKDGRPLSSATGLFQMLDSDRKQYGLPANAPISQQIDAGIRKTQDNWAAARGALGRDPTPAELYAVHYQGVGAGPALLRADPNAGFRDTLNAYRAGWGDKVVGANPWLGQINTVGDFLSWSAGKINPKVAQYGGAAPGGPPAAQTAAMPPQAPSQAASATPGSAPAADPAATALSSLASLQRVFGSLAPQQQAAPAPMQAPRPQIDMQRLAAAIQAAQQPLSNL